MSFVPGLNFSIYRFDVGIDNSWVNNCLANEDTNGIVITPSSSARSSAATRSRAIKGNINDASLSKAVNLPPQFQPTLPQLNASSGEIRSYVLSDNRTGVVSDPMLSICSTFLGCAWI